SPRLLLSCSPIKTAAKIPVNKHKPYILLFYTNLCYVLCMIWIAGDHAGFALKNYLIDELTKHGYEVEDLGPLSHEPDDDYPDYMSKAAKNVADGP
ncbi:RpiB/LacA/LacB family sugar-phosphate isomerase, partial [Patescibacteria group bacterium]|nr:RpiB/LacA/LacB family sugar-phosphate isomerase [Patescibacteria group bacterium]